MNSPLTANILIEQEGGGGGLPPPIGTPLIAPHIEVYIIIMISNKY